jgi:hypothetical protein
VLLVGEGALLQALAEDRSAPPQRANASGVNAGREADAGPAWVRAHALAPLAFTHGLTAFRPDFALSSIRAEQQRAIAAEAVTTLAGAGVHVMLLKGISYAGWLYAEPAERPMSDVDLLVRRRDHDRAITHLVGLGYRRAGPAIQRSTRHHAVTLKRPHAAVDLHRSPVQHGRIAIPMGEVWRRALPADWIAGDPVRPEPLDELLLHLANLARHDLIVPAVSFVDAGRMLRRLDAGQRATLARRAAAWGFGRVFEACLQAVEVACGWREPAAARWWLPSRDVLLTGAPPARWRQIGRKMITVIVSERTQPRPWYVVRERADRRRQPTRCTICRDQPPMPNLKPLFAATLAATLAAGTGYLAAQPGGDADAPAPTPAPKPAPEDVPLPDVTVSGETHAKLSPREMTDESTRLIGEMDGMHLRVLELQKSARKAKDVIKLNCVNEKLLAVKQLMNIADAAKTDLTEAISGDDRDAQVAKYGQVVLAHERATAERDEAEGCIGEELVFVGPTKVEVDGPTIPDDPTDDPEDPFATNEVADVEHVNDATPWF